jgi:hypothetical protein
MSASLTNPSLLDRLVAGTSVLPESREQSIAARFPVPSDALACYLINVPAAEWSQETGRSVEEAVAAVATDLRLELVATLADSAFAAIERGDSVLSLSSAGRFNDDFARELMRTLPIDPYVAPEVLERLHAELRNFAQRGSVEASWGHLAEREGDLEIVLPQLSFDSSRTVAIPG